MSGRSASSGFFSTFLYEEHGSQMPTHNFVSMCLVALAATGVLWSVCAKTALAAPAGSEWGIRHLLRKLGVQFRRVERAVREIERKAFHLCGLLVPIVYQLLLHLGYDDRLIVGICIVLTTANWAFEIVRLRSPAVQQAFIRTPFGKLMREKEYTQLTGGCYFALGCSLAICLFPAPVAITSIIFLVMGDMSAAIIGVSFGGEACVVKLGREGKKSAEGSLAMLSVCFIMGCIIFWEVHLGEYAVLLGAIAATLTELYEPFDINDNLSIPVVSCLAISLGLHRIEGCGGAAVAQ